MEERKRKFLFILNPIAGGRNKEKVPTQILNFCAQSSCLYRVYETTGKNDSGKIKEIFEETQPEALIAIGGDGTVNLVGNLLVGTPIPLGIIPLGSTNGLAKDLGIPTSIPDAFGVIRKFRPQTIDVLKINGRNCFHMSDFGFNARVCHRFAESIYRGRISYIWYGLREFFTFKSFPYQIKTLRDFYEGEAFMISIANANKFGAMPLNPLEQFGDGFFEISILKPFPRIAAPYIYYHLTRNHIFKSPYYTMIQCKRATIHNVVQELFHIDGEPVKMEEKVEVEINPQALHILV